MVIIFLKTLEKKKGVDDVRSNNTDRRPRQFHSMSKGTTLLSRGTVEADRWLDLGQSCAVQQRAPCQPGARLESLWGATPEPGCWHWAREPGSATAITSLIRDLSLGNSGVTAPHSPATSATAEDAATAACQAPAAPPSKRQCRSLSLSDELGGFRSPWRPQGSRVWTTVEKRRCLSGGSVRGAAGFAGGHPPAMQRSSSFSLPSRSSLPSEGAAELPFFHRLPLCPQFTASPVSATSPSLHHHHHHHHCDFLRPLSLSHEHIGLPELQREEEAAASEASSPDSTPELGRGRAAGCLSRSESQPCVLNDKKIAMKRRRPEDAQEPRPSLDLAKMNQKRQTFQSLSCPGFSAADNDGGGGGCQPGLPPPTSRQPDSDFTAASGPGLESRKEAAGGDEGEEEDSPFEELDTDSACSVDSRPCTPAGTAGGIGALWKGGTRRDIFQLGGELDLDQIERN